MNGPCHRPPTARRWFRRTRLTSACLGLLLLGPAPLTGREPMTERPGTGDHQEVEGVPAALIERIERATAVLVRGAEPTLDGARGTAVFVGGARLLTAGHAAVDAEGAPLGDLWVLRNVPDRGSRFFKVEVERVFGDGENGRDLALLRVADGSTPEVPFPRLRIGGEPGTGARVITAGFPLVFDRVYRWPLLRFGWVASNRYHLRESKVIVLDLTSVGGFSGAPVVDRATGRLVAILKGKATGNPASDFCLATTVTAEDIKP